MNSSKIFLDKEIWFVFNIAIALLYLKIIHSQLN